MKKLICLIGLGILLIACGEKKQEEVIEKNQEKIIKIGISEIVAHPSLDLAIKGIQDELENENVDIEVKIANGELATANLIAQSFNTAKKDIVVGIGTGSAQSLVNNNQEIPIVFAAVSDPEAAGLIQKNVTGVSDKLESVEKQLILLKKKFPNVKTIGVLYSTSELNSDSQIKDIEIAAKNQNLNLIKGGATNTSDLVQVVKNTLERSDALYVPTDNLVVSNIPYVVDEAKKSKKPLIASEKSSVEQGALFAFGVDYYELGRKTGEIIKKINSGEKIENIPYEFASKVELYFNEETAKNLNVTFDKNDEE